MFVVFPLVAFAAALALREAELAASSWVLQGLLRVPAAAARRVAAAGVVAAFVVVGVASASRIAAQVPRRAPLGCAYRGFFIAPPSLNRCGATRPPSPRTRRSRRTSKRRTRGAPLTPASPPSPCLLASLPRRPSPSAPPQSTRSSAPAAAARACASARSGTASLRPSFCPRRRRVGSGAPQSSPSSRAASEASCRSPTCRAPTARRRSAAASTTGTSRRPTDTSRLRRATTSSTSVRACGCLWGGEERVPVSRAAPAPAPRRRASNAARIPGLALRAVVWPPHWGRGGFLVPCCRVPPALGEGLVGPLPARRVDAAPRSRVPGAWLGGGGRRSLRAVCGAAPRAVPPPLTCEAGSTRAKHRRWEGPPTSGDGVVRVEQRLKARGREGKELRSHESARPPYFETLSPTRNRLTPSRGLRGASRRP